MTKEKLFELMNENPVMHLATVDENGFPLFAQDEERRFFEAPWIFKKDDTYYFTYSTGKGIQIRVCGKFELDESDELFEEIYNHPSREFIKKWGKSKEEVKGFIKIFKMKHGKACTWSMADNFKPKEYTEL